MNRLCASLLLLLLFLSACTSNTTSEATPDATPGTTPGATPSATPGTTSDAKSEGKIATLNMQEYNSAFQDFSSYCWQASLEIKQTFTDGMPSYIKRQTFVEVINQPLTLHIIRTQEDDTTQATGIPINLAELYIANNVLYTQILDEPWKVSPVEDTIVVDELIKSLFLTPEIFSDLPESAWRNPTPETVNGISTWHYSFEDTTVEGEEMKGDVWVAQEGSYPIKVITVLSNTVPGDDEKEPHMVTTSCYDLFDVSQEFSIKVPDEALNAPQD